MAKRKKNGPCGRHKSGPKKGQFKSCGHGGRKRKRRRH